MIPASACAPSIIDTMTANGVFPVLDYVPSGVDPDDVRVGNVLATDAIQAAAADAIAAGGVLLFPAAARLRYNDLLFHALSPVAAVGLGGWLGTKLIPEPSYHGPAIIVENTWRNGNGQVDDLTVDLDTWDVATVLSGLTFVAEDWADEHHGVWFMGRNDLVHIEHCYFMLLRGVALAIAAAGAPGSEFMRESFLHHVRIEQCGDHASGFPAAAVNTRASGPSDGTNHLTWSQLELVYNNGPFRVFNEAGATEVQRRLTIRDLMLHGKDGAVTAQPHPLMILEGRLHDVVIDRCKMNGSHTGQFAVVIRADSGGFYPRRVVFSQCSLVDSAGGGVRVQRCETGLISGTSTPPVVTGPEVQIDSGAIDGEFRIDLRASSAFAADRSLVVPSSEWHRVSGIVGPVGNAVKYRDTLARHSPIVWSVVGSTGSGVAAIGAANTNSGTVTGFSDVSLGWVNNYATAASANASAGANSTAQVFMGGAAAQVIGAGVRMAVTGVRFPDASYNQSGASTGSRIFVGLSNQTVGTTMGSDDPVGARVGFQRCHVSDGRQQANWHVTAKNGGAETLVDTGVPFVPGNIYELEFELQPALAGMWWRIIDWTAGTVTTGKVTANMPGVGVALRAIVALLTVNAVVRNLQFVDANCRSMV